MPITFQKKQELIKDLEEKVKNAKSVIFADFSGLESGAMADLRKRLRKENIVFKVVKKTLLKRVLRSLNLKDIADQEIPGQLSIAVGSDEVSAAKTLSVFIKETKTENLAMLGGILDQKFLSKAEAISLSKVPSKEELLGRLVGVINAPLGGLVNTLAGNMINFVFVLKQISNNK